MTQALISVASNTEPTHNIRSVLKVLEVAQRSRVFITKACAPNIGLFHNMTVLSSRHYSQAELRDLEQQVGRIRESSNSDNVSIDLDLQFSGDWIGATDDRCFGIKENYREEWAKEAYVGFPLSDIMDGVILRNEQFLPTIPSAKRIPWSKEIVGVFSIENMPQLEGSLRHHEGFMNSLLDFLVKNWSPPDQPIAASLVYNGKILSEALSQPRQTHDSTSHAEMAVMRTASKMFGREQLKESWLYTTHAPCSMCRETAFECGLRGIVWAIDQWEAPELYREPRPEVIESFRHRRSPTLYRGIGKERAQETYAKLANLLNKKTSSESRSSFQEAVLEVDVPTFYNAVAREYLDPELHPVAFAAAKIQSQLRSNLAENTEGEILDIGCGIEIPPVPGRFIGVDISSQMIAERHKMMPLESSQIGDAYNIPFEDKRFNAIFAGLVLDHVDSLTKVSQEFARVTKPKGHVWITLLTPERLPEKIYSDDRLHMRSASNVTYSTPIRRWATHQVQEAFQDQFEWLGSEVLPLDIRGFELAVYRLRKN